MAEVTVLIFHRPATEGEPDLVRLVAEVRGALVERHAELFRRAGASAVRFASKWHDGLSFGEVLAKEAPARGGLILMSGGAVPLLNRRDATHLVSAAAGVDRVALTNNRYSSDICAIAHASTLRDLPALPSDNAVPRWLEERAGYSVRELGSRDRLALDLDTPQDIAITALAPAAPAWLRRAAAAGHLEIPRLGDLRALSADPHRELLVFGRSGSSALRWLENNARSRVRFLSEERGMRASSPLAIGSAVGAQRDPQRPPRATLGALLDQSGPGALAEIVGNLSDGAIIDSRVLLAHHFGVDESGWPSAGDRFASDLHLPAQITDPWLRELTESVASSPLPILLGGHSLVGPGIPILLGQRAS